MHRLIICVIARVVDLLLRSLTAQKKSAPPVIVQLEEGIEGRVEKALLGITFLKRFLREENPRPRVGTSNHVGTHLDELSRSGRCV